MWFFKKKKTPVISIPEDTVSGLMAYTGQLFGEDLSAAIKMAVGLPVGFWAINKAIALQQKAEQERLKNKKTIRQRLLAWLEKIRDQAYPLTKK
jgi:hypothetical protein